MRPVNLRSSRITTDALVSNSRSRLMSVHAAGGNATGGNDLTRRWELRDGSATGDLKLSIVRHANGGVSPIGEIEIPANGIIFEDGIYVDFVWSANTINPALTVFYE